MPPSEAHEISSKLSMIRNDGRLVFFIGNDPVYTTLEDDQFGQRLALGMFGALELAKPTSLARALGCNPSTAFRNRKKIKEGGVDALLRKERTGPRGPSKLKGEVAEKAQRLLDEGHSNHAVGRALGLSEGTIRKAIKRGVLKAKPGRRRKSPSESREELKRPSERAEEDTGSACGIGVKRIDERVFASMGILPEAPPRFMHSEAVENAGVLLALPAVLELGFLSIGKKVYGRLRNGFYGLQSVLLLLVFMALLRIKTMEQLRDHSPGELGHFIGLDRVPEVKTIRRKLSEMGAMGLAWDFASDLAEHWSKEAPERSDFLYVDGHVRAYNGRTHTLPKTHVARRRLCMPATTDMWVNDMESEPLLFITAEANDGLLSMMNEEVLPRVRQLCGESRRITFVFDREGWSPKTFLDWSGQGFDVLTYRKGNYEPWPLECFHDVKVEVSGREETYRLGERSVRMLEKKRRRKGKAPRKEFWMREVRRLCKNGHQTSVMTTRQDLDMKEVAYRMFSRWRQENFFHYMRCDFALDHMPTYSMESADPERLVPNPSLKKKQKTRNRLKTRLMKLTKEYGDKALNNEERKRKTMRGFKIAESKTGGRIREIQERLERLENEIKLLPKKVPVKEVVGGADKVVRLEQQRKVITDAAKIAGYRAETVLLNELDPYLNRCREEGRAFLETVFKAKADIIPNEEKGELVVRYYPLSNNRSNRALDALCKVMNQKKTCYPNTKLQLVFQGPQLMQ